MNKLQKIKNSIRKFVTSPRFSSLALMLLVGTVACLAQNTAGNYEAGTSALTTVTEEIAKYVPIVVKLCYAIAGVVAVVGAISVYIAMNNEEQDVKKKNNDGGWSLHLPDCSSPGTAPVLRYLLTLWQRTQTTAIPLTRFSRGFRSLLNSWVFKVDTSTGRPEPPAVR